MILAATRIETKKKIELIFWNCFGLVNSGWEADGIGVLVRWMRIKMIKNISVRQLDEHSAEFWTLLRINHSSFYHFLFFSFAYKLVLTKYSAKCDFIVFWFNALFIWLKPAIYSASQNQLQLAIHCRIFTLWIRMG